MRKNRNSIPMSTHNSKDSTHSIATIPPAEIKKTYRVRSGPERPVWMTTNNDHFSKPNEEAEVGSILSANSHVEESGRERLKRHRVEMAGRVWIPDVWGQEDFLKDWIDCTLFDASLGNSSVVSARAALVEEGRAANSGILRIENRC